MGIEKMYAGIKRTEGSMKNPFAVIRPAAQEIKQITVNLKPGGTD